ncbi:hypothetical protein OV208_28865 [Corallococcus sp. bb12-1]|uniref:hypothetical protein n=1 Tax=Corallococcus sp. bb12-1 TaxID=2996784 RepID=UPI00226D507D|nr:hypothetical protein [Corallococcus sp. bb12-1]MCY1045363.1 hypothetical protein [Corallococcus sp. bb12-1]
MHVFEGKQAVEELGWLLDSTVTGLALHADAYGGLVLEATCIPRADKPVRELRMRFTEVTRFDFVWTSEQAFFFVPGYKALLLESGSVYVSLDPYDDRARVPDTRDGCVIEARSVRTESVLKSDP